MIAVGEIRDLATAEVAFQASLTGHLVLSTFHAGSAAGVIGRPVGHGDRAVRDPQRRAGRSSASAWSDASATCARDGGRPGPAPGPGGLPGPGRRRLRRLRGTGYRGRIVLAEILIPNHPEISHAIRSQADVNQLEAIALPNRPGGSLRTRPRRRRGGADGSQPRSDACWGSSEARGRRPLDRVRGLDRVLVRFHASRPRPRTYATQTVRPAPPATSSNSSFAPPR